MVLASGSLECIALLQDIIFVVYVGWGKASFTSFISALLSSIFMFFVFISLHNLNSNLFTTLDLTNVSVILPTPLNNNVILFPPYLNYTIDPSGQLFGTCDSTYYNYLVPNQIKS